MIKISDLGKMIEYLNRIEELGLPESDLENYFSQNPEEVILKIRK